jgi:hypothetical protein
MCCSFQFVSSAASTSFFLLDYDRKKNKTRGTLLVTRCPLSNVQCPIGFSFYPIRVCDATETDAMAFYTENRRMLTSEDFLA